MSDFEIWFKDHISQLKVVLPEQYKNPATGMTHYQSARDTLLHCLKSRVTVPDPKGGDFTVFPAADDIEISNTNTSDLEHQSEMLMRAFKKKTNEAVGNANMLITSATEKEKLTKNDQEELADAIKEANEVMQLIRSVYGRSRELESRESSQRDKMGLFMLGTGTVAVAGGCTIYFGSLAIVPLVIRYLVTGFAFRGFRYSARKAWTNWCAKERWETISKAIFEVGTHSHALWLFMIVYYMRQSGVITNNAAFLQFADGMAKTFGVKVKENWDNLVYCQEFLEGQTELIGKALSKVNIT